MNQELLERLKNELPSLMDYYSYDPQDSDYLCVFCGNRAETNHHPVKHKPNCLGQALYNELHPEDFD